MPESERSTTLGDDRAFRVGSAGFAAGRETA
jgi:hypothetical protein